MCRCASPQNTQLFQPWNRRVAAAAAAGKLSHLSANNTRMKRQRACDRQLLDDCRGGGQDSSVCASLKAGSQFGVNSVNPGNRPTRCQLYKTSCCCCDGVNLFVLYHHYLLLFKQPLSTVINQVTAVPFSWGPLTFTNDYLHQNNRWSCEELIVSRWFD